MPGVVESLGVIYVKVANATCVFHVLQDKFWSNANFDGILGREFCRSADCDILISENCIRIGNDYLPYDVDPNITIPAGSKTLVVANFLNFEKKEGHIKRINAGIHYYINS